MDDPALVRGFERVGDLRRDGQRFVEWNRPLRDPVRQGRPLDQLHHQRGLAVSAFKAVDGRDVRMIQRGEDFRFALEPRQSLAIGRHSVGEDLDGDLSLEIGVGGAIDLAHSAHADLRGNFVRAEASARGQCHCRGFYAITAE